MNEVDILGTTYKIREETSKHEDDISMFNHIYITSLWRRIENGKDVCLEAKRVK